MNLLPPRWARVTPAASPNRSFGAVTLACALAMTCTLSGCAHTGTAGDSPQVGVIHSSDPTLLPLGVANMNMKTLRPKEPAELFVHNVRVGSHAGFDRVVFDLEGEGDPGWFIDYAENPSQLGSGNPITYKGSIALNVNIEGTVYPFELKENVPDLGRTPGSGNVTEILSAGSFEGRSQFIIGLTSPTPYSAQILQNPKRLVIDFVQGS